MHEGKRLEVLAGANHKHRAAKLRRVDRRLDARLDAGALERDAQTERKARFLLDLGCDVLRLDAPLDEDRLDAGNELLGDVEAGSCDVSDDDGSCARCACSQEADEANRTGAAARLKTSIQLCRRKV